MLLKLPLCIWLSSSVDYQREKNIAELAGPLPPIIYHTSCYCRALIEQANDILLIATLAESMVLKKPLHCYKPYITVKA
jgi:hypothetical protein